MLALRRRSQSPLDDPSTQEFGKRPPPLLGRTAKVLPFPQVIGAAERLLVLADAVSGIEAMHFKAQPPSRKLISERNGEPIKVLVFSLILANPVDNRGAD